jgi:hypothetical protein
MHPPNERRARVVSRIPSVQITLDVAKIALTRSPRVYGSLRRPYGVARFVLRKPHDPDFAVFGLFPERVGPFLDVGANAGMSAMSFRIYNRSPIISIEPNPYHEADLRLCVSTPIAWSPQVKRMAS